MQEGLNIASEIDHKYWTTGELFDLGLMYCALYAPEKAQECLHRALPLAGEIESEHFSNLINGTLAKTYFLQGDLMKMQTCLENVIDPDSSMDTTSERYCGAQWADLLLAQSEPTRTLEIVDRLIASIPGLLPDRIISSFWRLRGEALFALGQLDQAESVLLAALRNATTFDEHFHLWRIHTSLGGLYQEMSRQDEAQDEFSIARELINNLATTIPDQTLKDNFLQGALALLDHSASTFMKKK
jgi:tetratricopeptide (TPR) repeat protein